MFDFHGMTIIVTGSGAGMGKEAAKLFAQMGANVVVNSLSASAKETCSEIIAAGGDAVFVQADVGQEADCRRLIDAALAQFLGSRLFARLKYAKTLYREVRFNLFVKAAELPGYTGDDAEILVQGIIDCCYIDPSDRVVLIDYKTDHFPRELCADREKVEEILHKRYADQLKYYRAAAEQLFCRPVADVRIYSFALGDDFSVF